MARGADMEACLHKLTEISRGILRSPAAEQAVLNESGGAVNRVEPQAADAEALQTDMNVGLQAEVIQVLTIAKGLAEDVAEERQQRLEDVDRLDIELQDVRNNVATPRQHAREIGGLAQLSTGSPHSRGDRSNSRDSRSSAGGCLAEGKICSIPYGIEQIFPS